MPWKRKLKLGVCLELHCTSCGLASHRCIFYVGVGVGTFCCTRSDITGHPCTGHPAECLGRNATTYPLLYPLRPGRAISLGNDPVPQAVPHVVAGSPPWGSHEPPRSLRAVDDPGGQAARVHCCCYPSPTNLILVELRVCWAHLISVKVVISFIFACCYSAWYHIYRCNEQLWPDLLIDVLWSLLVASALSMYYDHYRLTCSLSVDSLIAAFLWVGVSPTLLYELEPGYLGRVVVLFVVLPFFLMKYVVLYFPISWSPYFLWVKESFFLF